MTTSTRQEETAWFGAVLGIGAAAMLMLSLFFAEAYLRASAEMWPPAGVPRVPRVLPSVNVALLAAACALLHLGCRRKAASGVSSRPFDRLRGDRSHRSSDAASAELSRSGDRSHRSSGTGPSGTGSSDTGASDTGPSGTSSTDATAFALGLLFLALDALLWRTLLASGFTPAQTGAYGALFFAITFAHAALVVPGLLGLVSLLRRPHAPARRGWTLYWDFLALSFAAFVLGGLWL
jgi:heme/copper-type cytochrome/quinol oxidase subunit 3